MRASSASRNATSSPPTWRSRAALGSRRTAERWLAGAGGDTDGVVAKRLDLPYQSGNRDGMREGEAHPLRRLRRGWVSLRRRKGRESARCFSACTTMPASSITSASVPGSMRPFAVGLRERLESLDQAARLHRSRTRRPQPLEHRTLHRLAAPGPETGRRGELRSRHRPPLSPRYPLPPLAPRQGAASVHHASG